MFGARSPATWIAVALILVNLPYLLAPGLTDSQSSFSGFLLNPIDGFSYLAKMREGASGPLEFRLPYASEPGEGAVLFVYYLILGRIADWAGLAQMAVYQGARVLGSIAMLVTSYHFFRRTLDSPRAQSGAFALVLFGSGVGWLGVAFGRVPLDLQVPEAIPFTSAYVNAHFPTASALLLIVITGILFRFPNWVIYVASGGLALIQPFASLTVATSLGVWVVIEFLLRRRAYSPHSTPAGSASPRSPAWGGSVAFLLGALPALGYDLIAIRTHPSLAAWASQNLTPSPPVIETLLGYGLLIPLAAIGITGARLRERPESRLLVSWLVINGLLLYAPLALQRRLSLGLFFPLAALAGLGLDRLAGGSRRFGVLLFAVLVFSLPSHALVIGSGLRSVARGEPDLIVLRDDLKLAEWIGTRTAGSELVLAGPRTGNRLPALAPVRVLYGHPFETPDAQRRLAEVNQLYRWEADPGLGLARLQALDVDYVVYSSEEQGIGHPSWIRELELVHTSGAGQVYKVPIP